jgi:hypothetical protein
MPYPVGDRNVECPYCNDGVYENPETHEAETCPYCHGNGNGVIDVSKYGIISLKYDAKSLQDSTDGLGVKVDGNTIVIDPTQGLTVVPAAILPPTGYLSSGDVQQDGSGYIVPSNITISGHNISVESNGVIHANAETIKGFVAKLGIDIRNSSHEDGTELVMYTVESEGTDEEWHVTYDTTKPYEHFEFSTIVDEEKIMTGVKFKVTAEAHHASYIVEFTIDVHSF